MPSQKLRELSGLSDQPAAISQSALILIDCQNTYRDGVMVLEGVEPALEQCRALLDRYRQAGRPVIHVRHDAGVGSPYDVTAHSGAIADLVAPNEGEPVVTKNLPSSFENTNLDELLKAAGVEDLVLTGFMTHMCVNSTARAAFNRGYRPTVVAGATATRSLASVNNADISAQALHDASLAGLSDMFAVVVATQDDIPDVV